MANGNTTRGDYDQLTQIAKAFQQESDNAVMVETNLRRWTDQLHAGDWVGKAADAFNQEMNSFMLPSLKRLANALASASTTTSEIRDDLKRTEEEIARVLKQEEELSPGQGGDGGGSGESGSPGDPGGSGSPTTPGGGASPSAPSGEKSMLEKGWNLFKSFLPSVRSRFKIDLLKGGIDIGVELKWPPTLKVDFEQRGLLDRMGMSPSPMIGALIDNSIGQLPAVGPTVSSLLLGGRTTLEVGERSVSFSLTNGGVKIGAKGTGLAVRQEIVVGDKDFAYTSSKEVKIGVVKADHGFGKGGKTAAEAQIIVAKDERGFNYDGKNYSVNVELGVGVARGGSVDSKEIGGKSNVYGPITLGGGYTEKSAVEPISISPGKNQKITLGTSPTVDAWADILGLPQPKLEREF